MSIHPLRPDHWFLNIGRNQCLGVKSPSIHLKRNIRLSIELYFRAIAAHIRCVVGRISTSGTRSNTALGTMVMSQPVSSKQGIRRPLSSMARYTLALSTPCITFAAPLDDVVASLSADGSWMQYRRICPDLSQPQHIRRSIAKHFLPWPSVRRFSFTIGARLSGFCGRHNLLSTHLGSS